jgi:CRISPR-associated protein Csb1
LRVSPPLLPSRSLGVTAGNSTVSSLYPPTHNHQPKENQMPDTTNNNALPFTFGGFTIPAGTRRVLVTAELEPSNDGALVQPTGFPDIGPVLYPDPSGKNGLLCLVESEASMANRLEEVCFANKYDGTLASGFANIPYLQARKGEQFLTASTLDGHRFASDFLVKGKAKFDGQNEKTLGDFVIETLGLSADGKTMPIANVPNMFPLVFELDTMSLIHGFQISNEKISFVGLRMPRALTASIVAFDCQRVAVPGIKFNVGQVDSDSGQAIFQKPRITAKKIEARFSIDVGLLTSLSTLTPERQKLLLAIALWKVAAFLEKFVVEHSLRTECKLTLKGEPQVQVDKADKANFGYAAIKSASLTELITAAQIPQNRSPLPLTFA